MLETNESALDIITLVYSPGSDEEDQSPNMHNEDKKYLTVTQKIDKLTGMNSFVRENHNLSSL